MGCSVKDQQHHKEPGKRRLDPGASAGNDVTQSSPEEQRTPLMPHVSVLVLTALPPGVSGDSHAATVKIDGREALLKSVELFLNRPDIRQVQLVVAPDSLEDYKRRFGAHLSFSGVKIISGGPRWIDQIAAAVEKIPEETTHVLIHDAARPAVPSMDIDALLEAAEKNPIVVLTAPLWAALLEVDEGFGAAAWAPASRFVMLLTPQVFRKDKFQEMAKTKAEPHPSTLTLVRGSGMNIRVSSGADAGLVKSMIAMLPKAKVRPPNSPFEEAQW
jgi:2-C-methyl-D-erythritol 4-phosphate cytidylyltransferase